MLLRVPELAKDFLIRRVADDFDRSAEAVTAFAATTNPDKWELVDIDTSEACLNEDSRLILGEKCSWEDMVSDGTGNANLSFCSGCSG